MSVIEGFAKAWPFVARYRRMVAASFLFAFLVGALWGANLSLIFPVSSVIMQGTLQDYVEQEIQRASVELTELETSISTLDSRLEEQELTENERVERLEDRASMLSRVAHASRQLHWLNWVKTNVMPWIPRDQFQTVALLFGLLFVATAIKGLFMFIQSMIVGSLVELVTIDIRKACFRKCLKLDYQTLSLEGTPALMSRFTFDINELAAGIELLSGKMAREPFKAFACIALAFLVNWRLTLLSIVLLPLAGYIFYRFSRMLKHASIRMMESMSKIYQVLEETFNSSRVVIAFGNPRKHRANFHRENKRFYEKNMKIRLIDAMTNPTVELLGIGSIFITFLPCMYLLLRQTTSIWGIQLANTPPNVSTLMLLYTLLVGTVDPLRKMSSVFTKLRRSVSAMERIDKFLQQDTLVREAPEPKTLPRHARSIEFQDIYFAYATKNNAARPDALKNVSLKVKFGECVVVVGENGSGKSTLVNLLPRYYDQDRGNILIDDVDIQQTKLKDLRHQLGVVTQETFLFDGSIYDNIRYGKPTATEDEILEAAEYAGVSQFINQLPEGYQTLIGEKGASLSGGQRQRIALARALVRNPAILILDEATSAIDSQSEQHIQQALKKYVNQCTIFIITHSVNRNLLDIASRIVVMHNGELIAQGKHEQLLESCPIYHKLYQAQVKQRAA